jgi:hypothetical protein
VLDDSNPINVVEMTGRAGAHETNCLTIGLLPGLTGII